ncbi:ABC transporter substrate-binding protein [Lysinibacillus sp. 2017]|uniref:transporter substrate-binding domain-containing protein n=1 Tax=unclassified Lysinibacillus TaxID=2636778 RepID=UPI000D525D92|nr:MULTISPECIES: transporter substrate-binding domain-containing protein [unclassified Lysinibacillus]AWE07462.1 ABC transporter substrate-binding protein [Lysinibacillus sp. 2017]TGN36626.1 transporter substrate-binding domain-containing protein [Lysinibacillus sp. S2017]
MKKKLLVLFAAMMTMLVLAACGSDDEGSTGSDKKVLKVGMEAAYAPFNWTQKDDSNGGVGIKGSKEFAAGYDVEIAKKIADGLDMELQIVKTDWDGLVPSLQSGAIDLVIAGMSPTEDRKETIDFTENYYTSDYVIVVKKDGPYAGAKTLSDFSGAKITGQQATTHYDVIDQIKGVKKQVAATDFGAMRVQLQSGAIDGYVSERPEGISAEMALENFKYIVPEPNFEADPSATAVAVGLKKGSDLAEGINKVLAEISEDDRLKLMEDAIANQPAAQ